jgi:hypothetical protein
MIDRGRMFALLRERDGEKTAARASLVIFMASSV